MTLRGSINNTLKRDYGQHNQIVNHFFNQDREIPIWAIFESMTLGDFGIHNSLDDDSNKTFLQNIINTSSEKQLNIYADVISALVKHV